MVCTLLGMCVPFIGQTSLDFGSRFEIEPEFDSHVIKTGSRDSIFSDEALESGQTDGCLCSKMHDITCRSVSTVDFPFFKLLYRLLSVIRTVVSFHLCS